MCDQDDELVTAYEQQTTLIAGDVCEVLNRPEQER